MKPYLFIIIMFLLPVATAETGIVLNASDYVQYKYDTDTRPVLQPGEYIIVHPDINSVLKDAKYQGGVFVNPESSLPVEEIELQAVQSKIDPTQTIISGLTGAGAAYLIVRRRKVT